jgi:hypothetical protein
LILSTTRDHRNGAHGRRFLFQSLASIGRPGRRDRALGLSAEQLRQRVHHDQKKSEDSADSEQGLGD